MMQRINRGKAEAVFHTGFTGGLRSQGAPADPDRKVTIKPFEEEGVSSHYCVEDWHAILLGLPMFRRLATVIAAIATAGIPVAVVGCVLTVKAIPLVG